MKKYKLISLFLFLNLLLITFIFIGDTKMFATIETKKQMMFKDVGIGNMRYPNIDQGYDKIFFGHYNGLPLQWNVLNPKENSFGVDNSVLLLSSGLLGTARYGSMTTSQYSSSNLRKYIQDIINDENQIHAKEQAIVATSQKAASGIIAGMKDPAINDKFFAPTVAMMTNTQYGFNENVISDKNRVQDSWYWLAAKSVPTSYGVGGVQASGSIVSAYNNTDVGSVRIAANLDSSSIIMISDATGAQTSQIGSSLNENKTSLSHEYKLTIKDSTQTLDIPTNIQICNDELTFDYSSSGDAQFLCAAMTDASGQDILSYGKIKDISAEKIGSATIKLHADFFENNYKLQLYTLIDNGNMATDFSSDIVELPVPDPYTITIHYKDADGNDVEKKIWATDHVDISAYVPKPDDILSNVDGYRLPDNWEWQYDKEGTSFSDVTKEFTASPPYIKTWKVRYLDDLGKMIGDIQVIDDGMDALEPTPPIKPLYHFKKWDQSSKNIQKDMNIQAMYTPYVYTIRTEQETYTVGTLQIRRLFGRLSGEEIEKKLLQFYHTELYEENEIQHHEHIKVIGDIETLRKGIAGEYTIQYQYINEMDENFRAEKSVTFIIREASGIALEEPKIPEQSVISKPSEQTNIKTAVSAKETQLVEHHMTTEDGLSFIKVCLTMGISGLGIMIIIKRRQG